MDNLDQQLAVNKSSLAHKNIHWFLFLVAFTMLSGMIGYEIGVSVSKNKKGEQALTVHPNSTIIRTTPTTNNGMTNWKTFTNTTYYYSIQYPPDQHIINPLYTSTNIKTSMHSIEVGIPNPPGDQFPSFYIDVIPQSGMLVGTYNNDEFMQNLTYYISSTKVGDVVKPKNEGFNERFIRQDNIIISGHTAYVFESTIFHEKRVVIEKNNILYVIDGYNPDAQFNQILSTFKFSTL